jgi:hypothetical protein
MTGVFPGGVCARKRLSVGIGCAERKLPNKKISITVSADVFMVQKIIC